MIDDVLIQEALKIVNKLGLKKRFRECEGCQGCQYYHSQWTHYPKRTITEILMDPKRVREFGCSLKGDKS